MRQAVKLEQARVTFLYGWLDAARERAASALRQAYASGSHAVLARERVEREAAAAEQARRLAQLQAVEEGLVFGRIDHADGESVYIGRIGLRDDDHESVLIDWRAPAARPFYLATPSDPGSLVRRRHIHTRERTVVGLDDEVFDLERMAEEDRRTLVGEAALLAALRRGRTGRMSDVVATIQREQDRVIRSGLAGALVVQGGPGTGKTVAALHRAAYLLYTHRDTLERRGVLVVGPNAMFLRYISQVLPSLGETQVVLATVGELFPGVRATEQDPPRTAVVKGDPRMAELVAAAVADRQRVPDGDLEVEVEGEVLRVEHAVCERIRDRARAVRLPHNMARKLFVTEMLRELARAQARLFEEATALTNFFSEREAAELERRLAEEAPPVLEEEDTEADLAYAAETLWGYPQVRAAIEELWPELTPQQLVAGLLADPGRLAPADLDWEALLRHGTPDGPWTVGDVPLLDEAAELLGEDDSARRAAERRAAKEREEAELYAREVLEVSGVAAEGLREMRADMLAERHRDAGPALSTAERAKADRTWAYGHVIVDEAQELSPMAWRMIMRRVPARSLTVVGDVAQTGSAAGARSWGEVLDPYLAGRWREERLLINYRTPVEIMEVARRVLALVDPALEPPESVRSGGDRPRAVRCAVEDLPALVAGEAAAIEEGRVGVVCSDAAHPAVLKLFPGADDVDAPVAVLTVTQAKGLEFDAVVVVDPAGILAQPQGARDLYVAVTRATRRLTVAYDRELPDVLRDCESTM
ncbi:HelD family protein [Thermoactinospora rubra]|uniref:HelD family protein n=1 Tax=Thermoactinospora rubra TaxID=1088767 RepID=UPI000A109C28|nr:ATP-binding domain-containing protein [Thermoactinospora rubra]